LYEGLNERVGRLGVERQGTGKRQQLRTAIQVAAPETVSTSVEELTDEMKGTFQDGALSWRHVHRHYLLCVFAHLLNTAEYSLIVSK